MRMRLSSRLIFAVVLIEAIMLTLLVWNSVRLINSSHAELLERSTQEQTLLLANSLAPGLAFDDRATLQDVLSLLGTKDNLVYAAVHSRDGRLLASVGRPPPATEQEDFDTTYLAAKRNDGVLDVVRRIEVAGQYMGVLRAGYSIGGVELLTSKTRYQNAAIAGVELLLSIAVTILLGVLLTRNLRRLEYGAHALYRGELGHRIDIQSQDEIGDLAHAFNQLAGHLERTQTELEAEHAALGREKRRLDMLLNGIDAVIWEADAECFRYTYVSREAENMLGYSVSEWLEPDFCRRCLHPDDLFWVMEEHANKASHPGNYTMDYRMFDKSGRCLWVRDIITSEKRERYGFVLRGLLLDITDQKVAEERILYLAEHDALTGLINRRRFQEELDQHIAYTQRYGHQGALLFIDLDQFKYINDSFGHQEGDQFLVQVAKRLGSVLRETDILGRLGGDEFGLLLPRATSEEAQNVAASLLTALTARDLEVEPGHFTHISASIGIALFPEHSSASGDLLAKADTAMYVAKDRGRNQYRLFHVEDQNMAQVHAKIHWEERIRAALARDEFVLHYQPVVDLRTGNVSHHEALLRMTQEDGSLVAPGAFLGIAERFGLIGDIDRWVLRTAIGVQGSSQRAGTRMQIAVNLSGRHFGRDEILTYVRELIREHDADPANLIFEVTETAAVENLMAARDFIHALRGLGCRFALDDFGIGFSSFYYLKNLPVDFIKIDGSFVRNIHKDRSDAIFVKTIAELARGLGITTVAECIEHPETLEILRGLKVDMAQGHLLGGPGEMSAKTARLTQRL